MLTVVRRFPTVRALALTLAAATACLGSAHVGAQSAEPTRAEQLIRYRQALFTVVGGNFAPLAAMATGKAPFDAEQFKLRAERVRYVSTMLHEGFPNDSQTGARTQARPEIWKNRAEFDRLMRDMQARTEELAQVAKTGDLAQIKPAVNATGQSCKSCHDKFRQKD